MVISVWSKFLTNIFIICRNEKAKVLKNALCFIIEYLVAKEACVTLFWSMHFCKVHSMYPINVWADFEINLYKIYEFRNMQTCFIWRHVTQKYTLYVMTARIATIGIFIGSILKPPRISTVSGLKVMTQTVVFMWPWPMFSFYHTHWTWCTGISMQCFIRIIRHPIFPHIPYLLPPYTHHRLPPLFVSNTTTQWKLWWYI